MEERKHIVILAAGDFPTHPVPLRALREADMVVCCDSAYTQFSTFNFQFSIPFIVIGDGDSISPEDRTALGDKFIHIEEQDYNDLHKAMQWATSQFSILNSHFSIIGATGKREDHTLGNISYLVTFAEEHPGIDIEMLTDHGCFTAFLGRRTFASFPRQQVSVFALDPTVPFSGSGLDYLLDNMKTSRWWQATLNAATSESFSLWSEGWLIVFQTHEPKE